MKYLLDTCLLSELVKLVPEVTVLTWMGERKEHELFVSAISLAELHRGVAKLSPSKRRTELTHWLQKLEAGFEDRVLPFTQKTAHVWAHMITQAEAQGKPMAAFDSIIAATALAHGLWLVTRNVRDFAYAGVNVYKPWADD